MYITQLFYSITYFLHFFHNIFVFNIKQKLFSNRFKSCRDIVEAFTVERIYLSHKPNTEAPDLRVSQFTQMMRYLFLLSKNSQITVCFITWAKSEAFPYKLTAPDKQDFCHNANNI